MLRKIKSTKIFLVIHSRRAFIAAILFAVGLVVFEENLFKFPQLTYLLNTAEAHYDPNYFALELASMAYAFCLFCLFIWLALVSPLRLKLLLGSLFIIAIITQYGYWQAFHRFAAPLDFQTALKSSFGLWYTSANLFFNPMSLIPVLGFIGLLLLVRDRQKHTLGVFLILTSLTVGVDTVDYYLKFSHARNPGTSAFVFFRTLHNAILSEQTVPDRHVISFKADNRPTHNLVLIIDESIRPDHLDINGYHRATTPALQKIVDQGYLHNWGTAVSSGTCSRISNNLLITGLPVTKDNYLFNNEYQSEKATLRRLNKQVAHAIPLVDQAPTIFHYAKAMGYETHYLDAEAAYLWNGIAMSDLDMIDHWLTADDLGDALERDFQAAAYIQQTVTRSGGNFLLLNKRGVHYYYEDSYPEDEAIWLPTPPNRNYHDHRDLVVNAYDNGIRYNVNTFFQTLFADLAGAVENTTYIYTSDHGQTILEDNASWFHCDSSKKEAMVPLFIIGRFEQSFDTDYRASHSDIFATLLDLMDVPKSVYWYPYQSSLLSASSADSRDRLYMDSRYTITNFDE